MIKRVALVVPLPIDFMEITDSVKNGSKVEYLGYEYIAAYLRAGNVKVDIIDAFIDDLSIRDIVSKLTVNKYDFICFNIMSSDYIKNVNLILNQMNNLKSKVIVGGMYASFLKEKILTMCPRIDYVSVGEGEKTLYELIVEERTLSNINGLIWRNENKIIINEKRKLLSEEELDQLPFPHRENLDKINSLKDQREATVLSSRGCYGNCHFCGVASYYNEQDGSRWRARSAANVVEELKLLKEKHGVEYVYFADDEFIGPRSKGKKRALEFADLMEKENLNIKYCIYSRVDSVDYEVFKRLRDTGLDMVFLGVEFGVDRLLKFYNKGVTKEKSIEAINILNKLGIFSSIGYIMFEPTMTLDELKENLQFYFKYVDIRLMILLCKIGIYENSKAYTNLLGLIDIDDKPVFSESIGDIFNYRFNDKKVQIVLDIFNKELNKIAPSRALTKLRSMSASAEYENYNNKRWGNQLYLIIENLIEKLKATEYEEIDIDKVSYDFGEELIKWDETFEFKKVKIN